MTWDIVVDDLEPSAIAGNSQAVALRKKPGNAGLRFVKRRFRGLSVSSYRADAAATA